MKASYNVMDKAEVIMRSVETIKHLLDTIDAEDDESLLEIVNEIDYEIYKLYFSLKKETDNALQAERPRVPKRV